MKFKLYKELLNESDIMSHVFLNCANNISHEIADKNKGLTREEIENRDIDINLTIDGVECDPRLFFDELYSQYKYMVRKEAGIIVREQTSKKFREIADKLNDYAEICDSFAQDINWNLDDVFTIK